MLAKSEAIRKLLAAFEFFSVDHEIFYLSSVLEMNKVFIPREKFFQNILRNSMR